MKKWILLIIIFFSACTNPEPPKWYINTPKDNTLYFYASAEGYTKQEAIKQALNDIASRINVKISSNFVINKGIHNQKTYNEIYQQINTKISNISFNNYEIVKTEKNDEKYYVLIRVNKQKLINNLKTKIDLKFNQLHFENRTAIQKIISAYDILYEIKKLKSEVFILESLEVNITPYINKIQILKKEALNIIKTTQFKIETNKFKTENLEVLSKYFTISPKAENIIKINIQTEKLKLFNNFFIKGKAIILLDKPYTVKFLGKSISGYKEALAFAKTAYKRRICNLLKNIFKVNVF